MATQSAEIDVETLQAQIDLSMSFADNLISSWIKPSLKLPTRSHDTESELREYTRRPTRLGVGSKIPEAASHWREAGALKAKLKATKEEDTTPKREDEETEELESRTGAIKKRVMTDPFGENMRKKKKRKRHAVDDTSLTTPSTAPSQSEGNLVKVICSSPLLIKKPKSSDKNVQSPMEEPIADRSVEQEPIDISLTSTPTTSPRKGSGPGVPRASSSNIRVQYPLLNLDGPLETDPVDPNGTIGVEISTRHGKKRRRKKKHKKLGKSS